MKKNRMMRVASALLVAVLLTTCCISGTFAKYVSTADTSDKARVAKWGWGNTTISLDLFSETYDETVKSAVAGENVIAPGTSQTGTLVWTPDAKFAPEVDYTLSFAVTANIPAEIEEELDWTLKIDDAETAYTTFAALENALEAYTIHGEAATATPTVNIKIGWVWAFNGGDDVADTNLGNADTLAGCTVAVTMTATQVN